MTDERVIALRESVSATDEETECVTEIFDTSLPAESATGTPPLLSRITERKAHRSRRHDRERNEAEKSDTMAARATRSAVAQSAATTEIRAEGSQKSDGEIREERKQPSSLTIVQIVTGLVISLSMLWLLLTVIRAIKQLSNKN